MRYSEWGKRVRAGAVLAECSIDELAEGLGMSSKSLYRTIRGEREPQKRETAEIARLLALPDSFFNGGLSLSAATSAEGMASDLLTRIRAFRRTLDEEEARLQKLLTHHEGDWEAT